MFFSFQTYKIFNSIYFDKHLQTAASTLYI